jgi:hypothetical protein
MGINKRIRMNAEEHKINRYNKPSMLGSEKLERRKYLY